MIDPNEAFLSRNVDVIPGSNFTDIEIELSRALFSTPAQLGRILVVILFVFGILGNALLFCACIQTKLRQQSYSYFLRALVVVDSANLCIIVVEEFTKVALDEIFTDEVGCKIWEYFRQVCGTMSWWLTASLSCERFMILYHPFRGRVFCRGQHVAAVMTLLIVSSLTLQVHAILQTTYTDGFGCHPVINDGSFADLDVFVYKAIGYLVPTIVIVVCNCFVLRKVDSVCVRVQYAAARTSEVRCRFQKKRSEVTVMLLIITSASVFAAIPSHLANFVAYLGGEKIINVDFVIFYGLNPLLKATLMVTYGCNFYAYILFSTFRKQLKVMLISKLYKLGCVAIMDGIKRGRKECNAQAPIEFIPAEPQQQLDWHQQFVNHHYQVLMMNTPNRPLLAPSN